MHNRLIYIVFSLFCMGLSVSSCETEAIDTLLEDGFSTTKPSINAEITRENASSETDINRKNIRFSRQSVEYGSYFEHNKDETGWRISMESLDANEDLEYELVFELYPSKFETGTIDYHKSNMRVKFSHYELTEDGESKSDQYVNKQGRFKIDEINEEVETISGTFIGKFKSGDKTYDIRKGVFKNLKYTKEAIQ